MLTLTRQGMAQWAEREGWRALPVGYGVKVSRGTYLPGRHLILLAWKIALALHGLGPNRLIVTMPPRHGKSETITRYTPEWFLDHWPHGKVIATSYGARLAERFGRQIRDDIRNNPDLFRVRVKDGAGASNTWQTTAGGELNTAGTGGGVTGFGADLLLVDDPIKSRKEANSPTYREAIWSWFNDDAITRLMPGGVCVVVQTRWHEDDLAGRLISRMHDGGEYWEVVNLPAIAETDEVIGRLWSRKQGEALFPQMWPLAELERIRATSSDEKWASLYQQRPTTPGGRILKVAEWWGDGRNRYDIADPRIKRRALERYVSWDTAYGKQEANPGEAFTVGETFDIWPTNDAALRDVYRERVEFDGLIEAIEGVARRANYDGKLAGVLIEDKATGTSAYQTLKRNAPEWLAELLIARDPVGSKELRASQASTWCRNGMVKLPHPSDAVPFDLRAFEKELADFPTGKYADQVDAFSQAVIYLEDVLAAGFWGRYGNDDDDGIAGDDFDAA